MPNLTGEQWKEYTVLAASAWHDKLNSVRRDIGGFDIALPSTQALMSFAQSTGLQGEVYQGEYRDYALINARNQFGLGSRAVNKVWDSHSSSELYGQFGNPSVFADTFFSFRTQPVYSSGNIWDSIFGGPFNPVNFLNPISGGKALSAQFGKSSETVGSEFFTSVVNPEPQNYTKLGLQAGLNTVGSIGLGFGIEGVSSAYGNYASSTIALPTGVQGPVNPGFWGSLSQGNFLGAWDNLVSPLVGVYHAPQSIYPNKSASLTGDIGIGQLVSTITNAFGKLGQGIANFLSGNIVGGIQTFTSTTTTTPGGTSSSGSPTGNMSGSGGGGGFVGTNSGQFSSNQIGLVVIGLILVAVGFVVLRRKG